MGSWRDADGVVELPDGRRIRGRGLGAGAPSGEAPEFAVYLLGRAPEPTEWESRWVRWPDFRLPTSTEDAVAALRQAHDRAATQRVEVACHGGAGRTGTALALLAVLGGVPVDDAVDWVRRAYRPTAVETPWQRRWVARAARAAVTR